MHAKTKCIGLWQQIIKNLSDSQLNATELVQKLLTSLSNVPRGFVESLIRICLWEWISRALIFGIYLTFLDQQTKVIYRSSILSSSSSSIATMTPCTWIKISWPKEAKQPHRVMLLPPYLTVGIEFLGLKALPLPNKSDFPIRPNNTLQNVILMFEWVKGKLESGFIGSLCD